MALHVVASLCTQHALAFAASKLGKTIHLFSVKGFVWQELRMNIFVMPSDGSCSCGCVTISTVMG